MILPFQEKTAGKVHMILPFQEKTAGKVCNCRTESILDLLYRTLLYL